MNDDLVPLETITQQIYLLRGQKVLLDADLAALYGVETRRLNEQVRRNIQRFPQDFMFELNTEEFANLMSQIATSSWGGRRKTPFAFTEHGAIMAATVLQSARAIEVSVYVVRAFVQLRGLMVSNRELSLRLTDLERRIELASLKQNVDKQQVDAQLKLVLGALRDLMKSPEPEPKRPIGFLHPPSAPPTSTPVKTHHRGKSDKTSS